MAKPEQLQSSLSPKITRYFSEEFKRKKVSELEKRQTRVSDICRQYDVSSTAVYKWLNKFSLMKKKGVKLVVESKSDTERIKALQQHIAEMEQLLGQKQFEIDFLNKQMDIISEQYGVDFKKKQTGQR